MYDVRGPFRKFISWHSEQQFSLSVLFQCRLAFSSQVIVVGTCNSFAIFQIVMSVQFLQNTLDIALRADITTWNFLEGGEVTCFQAIHCTVFSGSKWWSQVSSTDTKSWNKLLGFSLNRLRRLASVVCTHIAEFSSPRTLSGWCVRLSGDIVTLPYRTQYNTSLMIQESPADAGIPARRKTMKKIPPFRSYNKFQSSRKSGVYSN